MNDDYTYRFVFEYWRIAENPVKVSSLKEIYVGMVNHYMLWGGRVPVHIVIQLLVWFVDKEVFNIINSLMVILLGVLIYFHVNWGKKRSLLLYVLIFTILWFFMPQPDLAMLNLACSVNSLWTCTYVLLFLIPYRILLIGASPVKHNFLLSVVLVPLGFLAGWSSEPAGAAAGAMAVLTIAYLLKIKKRPPVWAYMGAASLATGWAIMSLAPGYRNKAANYFGVENVLKYMLENFKTVEGNLIKAIFQSLWPILIFLLLSIATLYKLRKSQYASSNKKSSIVRKEMFAESDCIPELLFFISACISISIYVVAPKFELRYLFPATVFMTISFGIILLKVINEITWKQKTLELVTIILIGVCYVGVAADTLYEYDILSYNYDLTSAIENDIRTQVAQGKENVVIRGEYRFLSAGRYSIYKYSFLDMKILWGGPDSEYDINRMFAAYFDAKTYVNEANMIFVDSKL